MNSFIDEIKQGNKYLQNWPKQKVLNCLFVDSKIAFYTSIAIKSMPIFVCLIIVLNTLQPALYSWPVTLTFIFFVLGIPIQGLYWLGKRSRSLLPNQLLPWYSAIHKKIHSQRVETTILSHRLSYMDLALLLKKAFKIGGDQFLQQHELI